MNLWGVLSVIAYSGFLYWSFSGTEEEFYRKNPDVADIVAPMLNGWCPTNEEVEYVVSCPRFSESVRRSFGWHGAVRMDGSKFKNYWEFMESKEEWKYISDGWGGERPQRTEFDQKYRVGK